jgi:predicted peptidase
MDMKIDDQHNQSVGVILNKLVSQENILQNRIYLKNLINRAIKAYAG